MSRDLETLIAALPKAELHVHLEGSTPARLAGRWAKREGRDIPGLQEDAQGQWSYSFCGFSRFIECYIALSHCITQTQDLVDLATEVAQDMAGQGLRYAELTFTPSTHLARNWERGPLIKALHAAGEAAAACDVQWSWVFDFVRSYPDTAQPTVDFTLAARDQGLPIAGFGVGGPEGDEWPGARIAPAFERAKREGLASLPHAGENRGAQGVKEALELLGADRIGHGIRAVEDPEVISALERNQVCLEICPTSNLHLLGIPSLEEHPLSKIQNSQVRWTLASDDPPLVGTTLNDDYRKCAHAYGWDAQRIRQIAEHSFQCAILPDEDKARYLDQIKAVFERWGSGKLDELRTRGADIHLGLQAQP